MAEPISTILWLFEYSLDGGATFLPAAGSEVYLFAARYSVIVLNERRVEQRFAELGRIRTLFGGRIKVSIELHPRNFNRTNDPSGAKLIYIQDWLRKPLRRISHPAGLTIDGRAFFASRTNTYYVTPDEKQEPDIVSAFTKGVKLVLQCDSLIA